MRLLPLLTTALTWLVCAVPQAQAQLATEAQLAAGLAELSKAPLVIPRAAVGQVVPAQVQRWREEAKQLEWGDGGMPRDAARAASLYCQASRYGDAEAQYALGWMLSNGRGVERDDVQAAHLFAAAAEQGLPQAVKMAESMGTPRGDTPPCLKPAPPEPLPVATSPAPAATTRLPLATTWAMVAGRMVQVPLSPAAAAARAAQPVALAEGAPGQPPMPSGPLPANAPPQILNFVKLVAPEYNLAPQLVLAIMGVESGYHAGAVSPKNAQGLMQLIPETAARFGVRNSLDPAQNIRGGMAYLRWLLAYFQGDVALVAAAYNAGEGAVERYRGVPPYAETLNYVAKVLPAVGALRHPWDPKATAPSERLALMRDPLRLR